MGGGISIIVIIFLLIVVVFNGFVISWTRSECISTFFTEKATYLVVIKKYSMTLAYVIYNCVSEKFSNNVLFEFTKTYLWKLWMWCATFFILNIKLQKRDESSRFKEFINSAICWWLNEWRRVWAFDFLIFLSKLIKRLPLTNKLFVLILT